MYLVKFLCSNVLPIVLLGSLYLLSVPFFARGRVAPRWMRVALWTAGMLGVAWSLLHYTEYYSPLHFSNLARQRLFQYKTMCTGAMLGILFVLFASGEFLRAFRTHKPTA